MASIRRTLSPLRIDRTHHRHHNGSALSPFSPTANSTPNKLLSTSRPSTTSVAFFPRAVSSERYSTRRTLHLCLLFCFFGFLLGIVPFRQVHDIPTHDFSFEVKSPPFHLQHEETGRVVVDRPENRVDVHADAGLQVSTVSLAEMAVKERFSYQPRKLLIVVTPTYNRGLQGYYLYRLGHVLKLVNPPVLWIVVEMNAQSDETAEILRNMGVTYRHLVSSKNMTDIKDRGVHQRNVALQHIELHRLDGIVYFADDDNVYTLELFQRMREISRFGTWPVAMLSQGKSRAILEGPVCNGSQVIGWHTNEKSKRLRRFHVDMSGFAFNSTILWDPKRWKRPFVDPIRQLDTVKEGFQETTFIEKLVEDESQMQGIPGGCERIMNWHLHLEARGAEYPRGWLVQNKLDATLPLS